MRELKRVWVTEDYTSREGYKLPKGSCIKVEEEDTKKIVGVWASMRGSYYVSVPLRILTRTDPDVEFAGFMQDYMKKNLQA